MSFSSIFIFRPIMTTLLMISFLFAGVLGYYLLPVNSLPKMDFPTIQVKVDFPGTSAQTMSRTIALPLERAFASIAGIESMNSMSSQGTTQITLQFVLDRNIDAAAQDVGSVIAAAQKKLPAGLPNPPTYQKMNPSETPIIYLALSSATLPLSQIDMYAQTFIGDRISMLPGVAQVDVQGSQKYAVRIYANPQLLAMRQLALTDVSNAITNANILSPAGLLNGKIQAEVLNPNSGLLSAQDFKKVIIRQKNGMTLRLEDVADVQDSVENDRTIAWYNKTPAIIVAISRQPGANTIEVSDRVRDLLPKLKAQLPQTLNIDILSDQSQSIRESMHDVRYTFLLTMIFVILVIFGFLRNLRATIIPSITLPIAIIGTFAFMYYFNYSLNNLTLLALTLAIGYIVDDAIVVLENIMYKIENKMSPLDAAISGSSEISFTVLSMTLSLVAVFIPIIFMEGIVGRLFHEFAMTITIVILISCFISLTLTPMMCRFLPSLKVKQKESYLEILYKKLERFYKKSLDWVMKKQTQTLYFFVVLFLFNIFLFMIVHKGFFPTEDTGLISGTFESTAETSFESMKKTAQKILDLIEKDSDVLNFNISIGGTSLTNQGNIAITLKPSSQRSKTIDDKIQDFRKSFLKIPESQVFLQSVSNLTLGGLASKSQYQYTLQGSDLNSLYEYTQKVEQALKKTPGFTDVTTDLAINVLNANIKVDRDHASFLGVPMINITNTLGSAFGDLQISTIFTDHDSYQVILNTSKKQSREREDLSKLFVKNTNGDLVYLDAFAKFEPGNSVLTVNHFNEIPSTTVSFNLEKGMSLGEAIEKIDQLEKFVQRPKSVTSGFQGTTQVFKAMQLGQIWLILASIVTIYMILGMLYESYIHPITIISSLPTAGIGALLALIFARMNLDVISLIGLIMLIGIVKKNAIMMIDYALVEERIHKKAPEVAIIEAAHRRFRPIMMTTFAAIMGILPITFGFGAGAELRQPLGVAVAGGLLVSQILTLYITPVIYIYLDKVSKKIKHAFS